MLHHVFRDLAAMITQTYAIKKRPTWNSCSAKWDTPGVPVPTKAGGLARLNAAISKAGEEVAFGRTSASNAAQNVITEAGSILSREVT
ncbi:hypothetical protein [Arthrobacter sp. ISL-30]|uniref:hypothetical protein n=1 Tax=Arthrobacter sp. ISL-30 TaxID=2819109 RepID=UPI001BEC0603|nr:hypothetical protein [Arthrobacter sp. ISL-30]MBT2515554.1 hypothetical protein [Arthrobacter sp. ISL-30]